MEVVDYHRPEHLLSRGDWGVAFNTGELYELLEKVVVLSIYGNHDNIGVLKTARNL